MARRPTVYRRYEDDRTAYAASSLANLAIMTVGTSDEANLGAICRAMKNFGVSRLCAVAPRCENPKSARAQALACSAEDRLEAMRVVPTLDEACRLEEVEFLVGATARRSDRRGPFYTPLEFAREVLPLLAEGRRVGLLLGREDFGLTTEETDRCRWKVSIPTSIELASLNLAQSSVAILSTLWEVASSGGMLLPPPSPDGALFHDREIDALRPAAPEAKKRKRVEPALPEDIERLMALLDEALRLAGHTWETNPGKSLRPFRKVLERADTTRAEAGVFSSALRKTLYALKHGKPKNAPDGPDEANEPDDGPAE